MQVAVIQVIQVSPDDENPDLHEFGLRYFKFMETGLKPDPVEGAKPALWVRFSEVSQIETLQFHCPEAKLGPSHAFTEALVITESVEEAGRLRKKIGTLFADAQMQEVFGEDDMEDY